MDTQNIEREDGKVKFQVVVDAEAFEAALNKAYLKEKKRIMVPGFRKGKAPRVVVEGMYGKDVFYDEAVNLLALDAFKEGVKESGARTVGDPAITDYDVDDNKVLTVSYEAALYPECTLGEYKGLTAYREEAEITDEELAREMEGLRNRNARIVTVDRGAQMGDTLNIDYDGFRKGKRFRGGKANDFNVTLGSGALVPGFEDQLVGVKAGQETELHITFPENYPSDLAGEDAIFKVKVNEVQEKQLPELDDDFAQDVSEYDTLAELEENIRKDLLEVKKGEAETRYHDRLLQKAVEQLEVDLPEPMIRERVNIGMEDLERRCLAQGYSLEAYFQSMGMDADMYRRYYLTAAATNELRKEVLLEKIAETEGIVPTPEEVEEQYQRDAKQYGMEVDIVKERLPEEYMLRELKMQKAAEIIYESGIPTDKDEDEDEDENDGEDANDGENGENADAPQDGDETETPVETVAETQEEASGGKQE